MDERSAILTASTETAAAPEEVRRWFLSLREHPDRYQSQTHGGFVFTEGSFGEAGAHFETREQLAGIPVRLRFELTAVEDRHFAFRLLSPLLAVWGAFRIEPAEQGGSLLFLLIGGENRSAERILRLPVVRGAVREQIQREVSHIQSSVDRMQGATAPADY